MNSGIICATLYASLLLYMTISNRKGKDLQLFKDTDRDTQTDI